jgi:hypothetical protein
MHGFIGWNIVMRAALITFENALRAKDSDKIELYGKELLSDKSLVQNKREILEQITRLEEHEITITPPPALVFRTIQSAAFQKRTPAYRPFTILLTIRTAKWFPDLFDEARLEFATKHDHAPRQIWHLEKVAIVKPMEFLCSLSGEGSWRPVHFFLKYRNVTFIWPILDPCVVSVIGSVSPRISIRFPSIIPPNSELDALVSLDLTGFLAHHVSFQTAFPPAVASIHPSKSKTIVNKNGVESEHDFEIAEDGWLIFPVNPSLCTVTFTMPFTLNDHSVRIVTLEVTPKIGESSSRSPFPLLNVFPLQVEGRIESLTMIHLKLYNHCKVPLIIENLPYGRTSLAPSQSIYVLHDRAKDPFFVEVHEENGPTVRHEWVLDDTIMIQKITGTLSSSSPFLVGESVVLDVVLPPGEYEVIPGNDFIVCGKVKDKKFAGGLIQFQLIPIRVGVLSLPSVSLKRVVHKIYPYSAQVTAASALSAGPWVIDESPRGSEKSPLPP